MNSSSDQQRVSELTLQKCNGGLPESDARELLELLQQSELHRAIYWETIGLHSQLQWDMSESSFVDNSFFRDESAAAMDAQSVLKENTSRKVRYHRIGLWIATLAACFFVVASGWIWLQDDDQKERRLADRDQGHSVASTPIFGQVSSLVSGSRWRFQQSGLENGPQLHRGDVLQLVQGAIECEFKNHSVVILEAPCIMEALAVDRVRLYSGSIQVEAGLPTAHLSVVTAEASIDDLGTRYSVTVAESETDVVIYDGEIDLTVNHSSESSPNTNEKSAKRFGAGEAVKVKENGALSRISSVQKPSVQSFRTPSFYAPLIVSVEDNDTRRDLWKFYEIVPQGMGEDVLSFVDRPHQWNGVKRSGMPAYLVGRDYIKTYNDDKTKDDLKIAIELSRPAVVYVLLDDRVVPPQWLRNSFEDTGDDMGIDETTFVPNMIDHATKDRLESGPGRSIDRTHSVWKQTIPKASTISLGANGSLISPTPSGDMLPKASMYGVVVAPLEEGP